MKWMSLRQRPVALSLMRTSRGPVQRLEAVCLDNGWQPARHGEWGVVIAYRSPGLAPSQLQRKILGLHPSPLQQASASALIQQEKMTDRLPSILWECRMSARSLPFWRLVQLGSEVSVIKDFEERKKMEGRGRIGFQYWALVMRGTLSSRAVRGSHVRD